MNVIVSLIIGGVIGWLASIVMKTNAQMGMIANILVGIVGAWLGGWRGCWAWRPAALASTWSRSLARWS